MEYHGRHQGERIYTVIIKKKQKWEPNKLYMPRKIILLLPNKSYNTTVYNHFVDTLNNFIVIKKCCMDLSEQIHFIVL